METQLKADATKELERIEKIMKSIEILDQKASDSLVKVMNSYYEDSKSFFKRKQYLQALETAFIVWAYVDAGLHFKVFSVPNEMKKMFTI